MALKVPRVIGVTGFMGSGKDTIGNVLVADYGYARYAFADQLKSMALALDPLVPPNPTLPIFEAGNWRLSTIVRRLGWEDAKKHPEIRRFLQVLGTEGVREHLGEDSWIKALRKRIADDYTGRPVVITDVRFPNEAEAIWDWGGVVWRVVRPGHEGNGHASEREITKIVPDAVIVNNAGPLKLSVEVRNALEWQEARRDA